MTERPIPTFAPAPIRSFVAMAAIAAIGAFDVLLAFFYLGDAMALHGAASGARLAEVKLLTGGSTALVALFLEAFLGIVAAVFFLAWFHRAHRNLGALGARDLEFSPDWAIGGFFVPFLNLWRPRQVMVEVREESRPPGREDEGGAPLVEIWWFTFIGSRVLLMLANPRFEAADATVASYLAGTWMMVGSMLLSPVAAVAVVQLMRGIDRDQGLRHRRIVREAQRDGLALPGSACSSCGATLQPEARRCSFCGTKREVTGMGCGGAAGLFFGGGAILTGAGLCAVMIFLALQGSPPTYARPGDQLSASEQDFLLREGIVERGERVLWVYSGGLSSMEESGVVLTDQSLATYWSYGEEYPLEISRAALDEIQSVDVTWGANWLESTEIHYVADAPRGASEEEFEEEDLYGTVSLPIERSGDRAFVEDLIARTPQAEVSLPDA